MATSTKKKHVPVRNEEQYRAMFARRLSSAADRHTPKPRKGTRTAQKQRALRDW